MKNQKPISTDKHHKTGRPAGHPAPRKRKPIADLSDRQLRAIIRRDFKKPGWAEKTLAECMVIPVSRCTIGQVQKAVGPRLRFVPEDGGRLARIQRPDGETVAVLDLEHGEMRVRLTAAWSADALAGMPGGIPTPAAVAEARQKIQEELQGDWEHFAGFQIAPEGVLDLVEDVGKPGHKNLVFVLTASKAVATLEDVLVVLQLVRPGWCLTTLRME